MKRIRDKIVGELLPQPQTDAFTKGMIAGVVLGATVTLTAVYMNHLMQENDLLRASVQAVTTSGSVNVSASPQETTPPAKMKAHESLVLPPPFEDSPAAGKDISI